MIVLFTDGSALGTPGAAGWAYVAVRDNVMLRYKAGCIECGTNNQGELMAVIGALLEAAKLHKQYPDDRIVLVSDSMYVLGGIPQSDDWGFDKHRKNYDLWRKTYYALRAVGTYVTLKWVRGHDGNPNNELCDKLARRAARNQEDYEWQMKQNK